MCPFYYQYLPLDRLGRIVDVSGAFWTVIVAPNVQHMCREHGMVRGLLIPPTSFHAPISEYHLPQIL